MTQQIDQLLGDLQYNLSSSSMIPFFGTIPAAIKVVAGAIEIAVSIVFAVLLVLPSFFSNEAKSLFTWSVGHSTLGLKRIVVGAFLAVPLLGTGILCCTHLGGGLVGFGRGYARGVANGGVDEAVDTGFNEAVSGSFARHLLG